MEVLRLTSALSAAADPGEFTGLVWRTPMLAATDPGDPHGQSGVRFSYAPGAHSFWHVHACEQTLIALDGIGLIAWEGLDRAEVITPGDWVHVTPGVAHWHGAGPASGFVHAAVNGGPGIDWLRPVTDEEYAAATRDV